MVSAADTGTAALGGACKAGTGGVTNALTVPKYTVGEASKNYPVPPVTLAPALAGDKPAYNVATPKPVAAAAAATTGASTLAMSLAAATVLATLF